MEVKHKINMDVAHYGPPETVDVVQDDKYSRALEITMTCNGVAWEPPGDATVIVRYAKPDGKGGNYNVLPDGSAAGSISGNVVTVVLAPQVCTVAGRVELAVGLVSGTKEINTFVIPLRVERNPGLSCTSKDYFKVTGALASSGWTPNMYLGTDADGNVVVKEATEGTSNAGAITAIAVTEAVDGTVTVVNSLSTGGTETIVIASDASGNPASLTYNGTVTPITWTEANA